MIEAAELVVAALSAGAVAGVKDTASAAVKDSWAGLKALTVTALRRARAQESDDAAADGNALAVQVQDPEGHRQELLAALVLADAGTDTQLLDAARKMLALTDPAGMTAGKYQVEVHHNQGVIIGDHGSMTLHIGE